MNSKKVYQLVKGKSVEPFTCLEQADELITDRQRIDCLIQEAWNLIFSKYEGPETKGTQYRHASTLCLALTPLLLSLNPLWKISAILLLRNLSIILLLALMDGGHMSLNLFLAAFYVLVWTSMTSVRKLVISLLPFTTPIPPLFLKVSRVRLSVYVLLPFSQYPTVSTLVCDAKHSSVGKKAGSTPRNMPFATSLNSNLFYDLLDHYCRCGSFAGIQFDFAKCFDSIPYSFCTATNGLLQGDPLSVVIRNCVLRPLLSELTAL